MRSGLRNPEASVRAVGAGALGTEVIALLLGIVPLIKLDAGAAAVWLVVAMAALAAVLIGLLRRPWAWWVAWTVPVALIAGGALYGTLAFAGTLFAMLWAYVLYLRRLVLR